MTKQQSRAGSAGVMMPTRPRGAVRKSVVRDGAGRNGAVRGGEGAERKGTGRRSAMRLAVPLVTVAGLAACLTACSSTSAKSGSTASAAAHQTSMPGSPSSPGTATPTGSPSVSAAACEHVRALREDLIKVTHVKYNGSTAKVVAVDLSDINKELAALKNEPALAGEVSALGGAVTNVQGAIKAMSTPPTVGQLKAVATSFNNMKATASPTIAKFKAACP